MGHVARLRKVGGSVMVAIPPAALAELNLKPGADVELSVKGGKLMIDPAARTKRRYTLDELLARCKPGRRSKEDKEWLAGGPAGRELI
jgi:antitoxin ChpS